MGPKQGNYKKNGKELKILTEGDPANPSFMHIIVGGERFVFNKRGDLIDKAAPGAEKVTTKIPLRPDQIEEHGSEFD